MTIATYFAPLAVMGAMGGAAWWIDRWRQPWRIRERERMREIRKANS